MRNPATSKHTGSELAEIVLLLQEIQWNSWLMISPTQTKGEVHSFIEPKVFKVLLGSAWYSVSVDLWHVEPCVSSRGSLTLRTAGCCFTFDIHALWHLYGEVPSVHSRRMRQKCSLTSAFVHYILHLRVHKHWLCHNSCKCPVLQP